MSTPRRKSKRTSITQSMFKNKGNATGKSHGLHATTLTVEQITNSSAPLNESQVSDSKVQNIVFKS